MQKTIIGTVALLGMGTIAWLRLASSDIFANKKTSYTAELFRSARGLSNHKSASEAILKKGTSNFRKTLEAEGIKIRDDKEALIIYSAYFIATKFADSIEHLSHSKPYALQSHIENDRLLFGTHYPLPCQSKGDRAISLIERHYGKTLLERYSCTFQNKPSAIAFLDMNQAHEAIKYCRGIMQKFLAQQNHNISRIERNAHSSKGGLFQLRPH